MNSRQAAALQMEPNPLQRALDNYQELERQWHEARREAADLHANNAALLSEVGMLRDLLMAADADRVRWQATAATLLGRLYAINDVVGGAVKAAIRDGLEAKTPEDRTDDLEKAGDEIAAILQRIEPAEAPKAAPEPEAPPAPPQRAAEPFLPMVDFGEPRRAVSEFRR
jgi:hypothetical protein